MSKSFFKPILNRKYSRSGVSALALTGVAAAALLFSPTLAAAQDPDTEVVTMRDAVAAGVWTHPEYGVTASSRRATDEELEQAKALYLPSLDLSADTGYEYTDDPGTRAGTDGDDEESLWRYETSLTLTQMLFDGWETRYEVERQKWRIESSTQRARETAELVGFDICESYLEVMRQRELLAIARENVAEHLSFLEQIQDGVMMGRSSQSDLEQARARLAGARAQEASVRESLRRSETQYLQNIGDMPGDLVMPAVPVDQLNDTIENEVRQALTESPTLSIFEADIEVAHAELNGTQSTYYPQVDFQLNGRTGEDLGGVEGKNTSASALVVMNWNLYRGGADVARAREFIHHETQAKERRDQAARALEGDVRRTWAGMQSAGERAREFATQAAANVEVVKAYKDQFNLDRRTLLDVLDAQNELFVSRSNMVNAEFVEMLAVYRLLALRGSLFPTLGVGYPPESLSTQM